MNSHYKIIHTTCHTQWGGLEKRIFNESVWMYDHGHQVVLVVPGDTPLYKRAKKHGFRVYAMSFERMKMLSNYKALLRIFSNELPNILNTHGNVDAKVVLPAAKKAGIPCRILSRHISAHVNNSWYNRLLYKQLSHYVFTTADYTTRHLQSVFHLKNTKVFSIPSGIHPPENLISRNDARKKLAAELRCDPDTRFVGFVGRLSKDKGVSTLVKAFEKVWPRSRHHLVLAGNGPDDYKAHLTELTKILGISEKTHFLGFKEDVWSIYRALDCKVLASENINGIPFEGVPQALLEAMYCDCPVIGSRTGGIPDIIEHNITGLLFDPGDVDTLAKLMLNTLSLKTAAQERALNAFKKVQQGHTIEAMGRNIQRIYQLHHQLTLEKH